MNIFVAVSLITMPCGPEQSPVAMLDWRNTERPATLDDGNQINELIIFQNPKFCSDELLQKMEAEKRRGKRERKEREYFDPVTYRGVDADTGAKKRFMKKQAVAVVREEVRWVRWEGQVVPTAVDMYTGQPVGVNHQGWVDSEKRAASGVDYTGRLLGFFKVEVRCEQGLKWLAKEVVVTKKSRNYPGFRCTWNEFGQFQSEPGKHVDLRDLISCVDRGVVLENPSQLHVLKSIARLQQTDSSPWNRPLIRLTSDFCSSSTLKYYVYGSRLLFEMISDDDLKCLLDNITCVGQKVCLPTRLEQPVTFKKSPAPSEDDSFSLAGLMRYAESTGYACRDDPPARLVTNLFEYQQSTVQWMIDQERDLHGLNGHFWERREFGDEGSMWYFQIGGELRLQCPPHTTGGILCEELGLGKSIECISLMLSNPRPEIEWKPSQDSQSSNPWEEILGRKEFPIVQNRVVSRGTLIIAPSILIEQWSNEIIKHVDPDSALSVVAIYNRVNLLERRVDISRVNTMDGTSFLLDRILQALEEQPELADFRLPSRIFAQFNTSKEGEEPNYALCSLKTSSCFPLAFLETFKRVDCEIVLADADVVVTSYSIFRSHYKLFRAIDWYRCIVDESQLLRNSNSAIAGQCASLHTTHRWMVSGTPFHSSITDLHGQLQFLKVWPFCLQNDGFWERCIEAPWALQDSRALTLLHKLISTTAMRHSKAQTLANNPSRSIVACLPPRRVEWIALDTMSEPFSENSSMEEPRFVEQHIYWHIEQLAVKTFNRLEIANDNVTKEQFGTLRTLISLLSLASSSPSSVCLKNLDDLQRRLTVPSLLRYVQFHDAPLENAKGIAQMVANDVLRMVTRDKSSRLGGLNRDVGRSWAMKGEEIRKRRDELTEMTIDELQNYCVEHHLGQPFSWQRLPGVYADVPSASFVNENDLFLRSMSKSLHVLQFQSRDEDQRSNPTLRKLASSLQAGAVLRLGTSSTGVNCTVESGMWIYGPEATYYMVLVDKEVKSMLEGLDLSEYPVLFGDNVVFPVSKRVVPRSKEPFIQTIINSETAKHDCHETGFQTLIRIIQEEDVECPLCLSKMIRPCITQCVHAFCRKCILQHLGVEATSKCPICRRFIQISTVVEILPNETEQEENHAVISETSAEVLKYSIPRNRVYNTIEASSGNTYIVPAVHINKAITSAQLEAKLVEWRKAMHNSPFFRRSPMYPSISPELFFSFGAVKNMKLCSKIRALLLDMRRTLAQSPQTKFVIFSQFGWMIMNVKIALNDAHIESVALPQSTSSIANRESMHRFRNDSNVRAMLLCTGSASAGLSLPCANVLYMLEPCANPKDEAQALSRVHRLGQNKPVRCVVFFTSNTIEERILFVRQAKSNGSFSEFLETTNALSSSSADPSSSSDDTLSRSTFSLQQTKSLLGI